MAMSFAKLCGFMMLIFRLFGLFSAKKSECTEFSALGMEDGSISNEQITASSFYTGQGGLYAGKGRLNGNDYWATATENPTDPWIQVDLSNTVIVAGIGTQGSAHPDQEWVTALKIQTGESENALTYIMEDNEPKVFPANTNKDTAVNIFFPEPVSTRYLRIRPTEWQNWCSLRFEMIGCEIDVQVESVTINSIIPEYANDGTCLINGFQVEILVYFLSGSTSGTGLWKLALFGSNTDEPGVGSQQIERLEQVLNMEQQNKPVEVSNGLVTEVDFQEVKARFSEHAIRCDLFKYICVEFSKGDNPEPNFTLVTSTNEAVVTTCFSISTVRCPVKDMQNDMTQMLQTMANCKLSTNIIGNMASDLDYITTNITEWDDLSAEDIDHIATMLTRIAANNSSSSNVTIHVFNTVDNILNADDETFAEAQLNYSAAPSRILRALEKQLSNFHNQSANLTLEGTNLAVYVINLSARFVAERGVGFSGTETSNISRLDTQIYYDKVFPVYDVSSSIFLPGNIARKSKDQSPFVPVTFIVYKNSRLFQPQQLSTQTEGFVIAATIEGTPIHKTKNPVVTTFEVNPGNYSKSNYQCVFWDIASDPSDDDWSSQGCITYFYDDGVVTCHCDHLTSFAVLLNPYGNTTKTLSLISYIGLVISIIALIATIITFLLVKNLRTKSQHRILLNLCTSLLFLYVTFAVGIQKYPGESEIACTFVAALLHYFTLTSIGWMSGEAVSMYFNLVQVLLFIKVKARRAGIFAWGLPLLIMVPLICVPETRKQYYDDKAKYCFIRPGKVLIYGQILPVIFCIIINFIIYGIVMYKITCGRKGTKKMITSSGRTKEEVMEEYMTRLRRGLGLSILLGITWIFAVFTIIQDANIVFQYLFVIFNSLQGLFIFLYFCLFQKSVRKAWSSWFYMCGKFDKHHYPQENRFSATPSCSSGPESQPGPTDETPQILQTISLQESDQGTCDRTDVTPKSQTVLDVKSVKKKSIRLFHRGNWAYKY